MAERWRKIGLLQCKTTAFVRLGLRVGAVTRVLTAFRARPRGFGSASNDRRAVLSVRFAAAVAGHGVEQPASCVIATVVAAVVELAVRETRLLVGHFPREAHVLSFAGLVTEFTALAEWLEKRPTILGQRVNPCLLPLGVYEHHFVILAIG